MPLSLADNTTCVVFAGDHLQMKQRVFSNEAHELNFDKSIVERLYSYYESVRRRHGGPMSSLPIVQLKHNYRNDATILRFLSATFYGGADVLMAYSKQPAAPSFTPINFYAAFGTEVSANFVVNSCGRLSWLNLTASFRAHVNICVFTYLLTLLNNNIIIIIIIMNKFM